MIHLLYMLTTKKRINISLSPEAEKMLKKVARRDEVPEATKAARLVEFALELEEDAVFENIARERDVKGARFFSHKKAWA